jgi:hypothetical protein
VEASQGEPRFPQLVWHTHHASLISGGIWESINAVPALGWAQIVLFLVFLELAFGATDPNKEPGDIGGPTWVR